MEGPTYKHYLGDSVYVEIERGMIKLTTNNGYDDDPRNVIYMEIEVWNNFNAYMDKVIEIYKRTEG
jgi:hypothetical protein